MTAEIWKHLLRTTRAYRKAVMLDARYQPKPTLRECVEGCWDAVNEYHQ